MDEETQSVSASRTYGGVAASDRRAQRREALLDAALDLLAEGGVETVTKRAVCARARLNDRYFYEQFADRDTLLRTLAEELSTQGIAAAVEGTLTAGPDIPAQFRGGVNAAFSFLVADRRRSALLEASYRSEVLHAARVTAQHAIARAMTAVRSVIGTDPDVDPVDAEMTGYVFASGTLDLAAAWSRSEFDATQEHLVDLVTDMLLATSSRRTP